MVWGVDDEAEQASEPGEGYGIGRFQENPAPTPTGSTRPDARQSEFRTQATLTGAAVKGKSQAGQFAHPVRAVRPLAGAQLPVSRV